MQNSAVNDRSLWAKLFAIIAEGGLAGALVGMIVREPRESFEIVVAMTLAGLGFGWAIADYIRGRSGHTF